MPEITFDVELYCTKCGAGICASGTVTERRRQACFQIDPCEKCLEHAKSDADEEGYARGYDEGRNSVEEIA